MEKTHLSYLLLGANLGDRAATLEAARRLIGERVGRVELASHLYETEAWGLADQPNYLNQALAVETAVSPEKLLAEIHAIEAALGRVRREKWAPRPIDIDILLFEGKVLKTKDLNIPHPQLAQRNFALVPLMEIAPELVHPLLEKTIEEIYWDCEDELEVVMLDPLQSGLENEAP